MTTGFILAYIAILLVLYLIGQKWWRPVRYVFSLFYRGALGALGIFLFNQVASAWQVVIPLNPFNALFTGFLGLPGLLSLWILKYVIQV